MKQPTSGTRTNHNRTESNKDNDDSFPLVDDVNDDGINPLNAADDGGNRDDSHVSVLDGSTSDRYRSGKFKTRDHDSRVSLRIKQLNALQQQYKDFPSVKKLVNNAVTTRKVNSDNLNTTPRKRSKSKKEVFDEVYEQLEQLDELYFDNMIEDDDLTPSKSSPVIQFENHELNGRLISHDRAHSLMSREEYEQKREWICQQYYDASSDEEEETIISPIPEMHPKIIPPKTMGTNESNKMGSKVSGILNRFKEMQSVEPSRSKDVGKLSDKTSNRFIEKSHEGESNSSASSSSSSNPVNISHRSTSAVDTSFANNPYLDPSIHKFSYQELKDNFPRGVKENEKESYLTDVEFKQVFEMDRRQFADLSLYKRRRLKIEKGLF